MSGLDASEIIRRNRQRMNSVRQSHNARVIHSFLNARLGLREARDIENE